MVPYALPRSTSKMAKVLVAAILVWFVEFKQTMGLPAIENNTVYTETPSCCQVTVGGNGQGTITAPAINTTIVESSQLVGACLINASASKNNYIICTHLKAATSSAADCISHDPPNPWCQDNVISLNFTKLSNGSGLLFATIQLLSCDMKLGLSLRGSGIHSFKAGVVCQYDCTSVASGQENLSTQSTLTIALSSSANGSTGTVAGGQENLSTQSTHPPQTIALSSSANGSTGTVASGQENFSTSANGSTGTDPNKPSIAVGKIIGICIGCAVLLALLLVVLVCKYKYIPNKKRARSRTNSSQGTSSIELTDTTPNNKVEEWV